MFASDHSPFNTTSYSGASVIGGGFYFTSSGSCEGYKLPHYGSSSSSMVASSYHTSISSPCHTLPENPITGNLSKLPSMTSNFLSTHHPSSSSSWRFSLHSKDVEKGGIAQICVEGRKICWALGQNRTPWLYNKKIFGWGRVESSQKCPNLMHFK